VEIDITLFGKVDPAFTRRLLRWLKENASGAHATVATCQHLPARDGSRQPTVNYEIEHMGTIA